MKSQIAVYLTENAQRNLAAQGKNANRYQIFDVDLNPDSPLTKEMRIDADGVLRGYVAAPKLGNNTRLKGESVYPSDKDKWADVACKGRHVQIDIMPLNGEITVENLEGLLLERSAAYAELCEAISAKNPADWYLSLEGYNDPNTVYTSVSLDGRDCYPHATDLPKALGEQLINEYKRRREIEEAETKARKAAEKEAWELKHQQELAEQQKHDDERAAWIAAHGSALLKANHDHGLRCNRTYLDERLAHDYPGFEWNDDGEDNALKCASVGQLQAYDGLVQKHADLDLGLTWIKFPHEHDEDCYDCDLVEQSPAGAYAVGTSPVLHKSIRLRLED